MRSEKISRKMFQVLRDGFNKGKVANCPKNTKRALVDRGLLKAERFFDLVEKNFPEIYTDIKMVGLI